MRIVSLYQSEESFKLFIYLDIHFQAGESRGFQSESMWEIGQSTPVRRRSGCDSGRKGYSRKTQLLTNVEKIFRRRVGKRNID